MGPFLAARDRKPVTEHESPEPVSLRLSLNLPAARDTGCRLSDRKWPGPSAAGSGRRGASDTPPGSPPASSPPTCPPPPASSLPRALPPASSQHPPSWRKLLAVSPQRQRAAPTFVILQPHPKFRQDVVPQGIAELQDLGDWAQRSESGKARDSQDGRLPSLRREQSCSTRPDGPDWTGLDRTPGRQSVQRSQQAGSAPPGRSRGPVSGPLRGGRCLGLHRQARGATQGKAGGGLGPGRSMELDAATWQ